MCYYESEKSEDIRTKSLPKNLLVLTERVKTTATNKPVVHSQQVRA